MNLASSGYRSRQRGLALVMVLWTVILLALIAAAFLAETRSGAVAVRNELDAAKAEALAEAAVARAVFGLMEPIEQGGWRADGTVYAWRRGGGELRVAVRDEGGKVDLNHAPADLLANLFRAAGAGRREAAALADAVADFRDGDDLRQPDGAEDPDYEAAGRRYGAKDAPFETVSELQQVMGMTPELYAEVGPALTVHSGQGTPRGVLAPPLVQAALAERSFEDRTQEGEREHGEGVRETAEQELETAPTLDENPRIIREGRAIARSRLQLYTLHAEARSEGGALFVREAVVRVTGRGERPFDVLLWRRGERRLFD